MRDSKLGQGGTKKNQRILLSSTTTELCVAELGIWVAVESEVKESGITSTRAARLAVKDLEQSPSSAFGSPVRVAVKRSERNLCYMECH